MNIHDTELEQQEETDILVDEQDGKKVMVYNDEYNTFDHVIKCLVTYCEHTYESAGQCALIIHTTGQHCVKEGTEEEVNKICNLLCTNGLDAKVV